MDYEQQIQEKKSKNRFYSALGLIIRVEILKMSILRTNQQHYIMLSRYLIPIVASAALLVGCGEPANKDIVLHYDFNDVVEETVIDNGPYEANAILMNGATVGNSILSLGQNDGYLDMSPVAGTVMQDLNDFSVSAIYRLDPSEQIRGYGYFLWCFSDLEENAAKEGPYHAFRINEQRCETSTGGYTNETGVQTGTVAAAGSWTSVIFRQQDGHGELLINGKVVDSADGFPAPSEIFASTPWYNWIGRPPFNGDHYLHGVDVYDFRIYKVCIDDKEVSSLVSIAQQL